MILEYTFRCLDCHAIYRGSKRQSLVGPVLDEVVIGKSAPDIFGFALLQTKPKYSGRIESVACPYCLYSIVVAAELPVDEMKLAAESVLTVAEIEAFFCKDEGGLRIRNPPFGCPYCSEIIQAYDERKRCRVCKSPHLQISTPRHVTDKT